MGKLLLAVIMIFAFMGIAFADVGPPPPGPEISLSLFKNGALYADDATVEFVCLDLIPASDSPVGERVVNLTCVKGICTNDQWFYKFNPCYKPASGKFRYKLNDWTEYKETGLFDFSQPGKYNIILDVDKGTSSNTWVNGNCSGIIALAGVAGLLAIAKRSLGK